MAVTEFGSGSAFAVQRWSAELAHEAIGQTWFSRLLGEGTDACIRHIKDLDKSAGELVRYDVRYVDRNPGVQGDTRLEGFESSLEFYQDSLYIDQLRQAHAFRGMTQQRTVHDLRKEGRASLADWFARMFDAMMMHYLAGVVGDSPEAIGDVLGAGGFAGNALEAPDSDHTIGTGGAGNEFDITLIDQAVAQAKVVNPRLRPIMINGQPKYVAILHPWAVLAMKVNSGTNQWNLIHQNASQRGSDNPIYSGALGEYNGVILHESEYIPVVEGTTLGDGTGVTHNLFLGAGAGAFAMGNAWDRTGRSGSGGGTYFKYAEQERDYGNEKGVSGSAIFGMKKCTFNSTDFGAMSILASDSSTGT